MPEYQPRPFLPERQIEQLRAFRGEGQRRPDFPPGLINPLYPRRPPIIPPGCQPGPPDFVGVGTMRSGTSWWFHILSQHPRFQKKPGIGLKELHFFDHYLSVVDIDPLDYHRYFPRPAGMIAGEWTPRYMFDYWTAPMLRRVAPDAKLLVLLRDPIERYRSALAYFQDKGHMLTYAVLQQQYSRSLYGQQLRTLVGHFPVEQILVLQFEQCIAEPVIYMYRTLEFLGLDPSEWHRDSPPDSHVNKSNSAKLDMNSATREALRDAFRLDLELLFEIVPSLDSSLWPTMSASSC
jgi:hypothetical protein